MAPISTIITWVEGREPLSQIPQHVFSCGMRGIVVASAVTIRRRNFAVAWTISSGVDACINGRLPCGDAATAWSMPVCSSAATPADLQSRNVRCRMEAARLSVFGTT